MTLALLAAFAMAVRPVRWFVRCRLIAAVAREISLGRWKRQQRRRRQAPRPSARGRRAARAFMFQAERPAAFPSADDAVGAYVPAPPVARRSAPPPIRVRPSSA